MPVNPIQPLSLNKSLIRDSSLLSGIQFTDNIGFDTQFESVSLMNLAQGTISRTFGDFSRTDTHETYNAGQDIDKGDAVYVSDGITGGKAVSSNSTNTTQYFVGELTPSEQAAQSITLTSKTYIKQITLTITANNSPIDDVEVALQLSASSEPDGTDIAVTAAVDVAGASSYTFTFSTVQTMDADVEYWFVVRRTGSLDATNNYNLSIGDGIAGEGTKTLDDGTWSSLSGNDFVFSLLQVLPANNVGVAEADITGRFEGFVGFAALSAKTDFKCLVQVGGVATFLSGLTSGVQYFLSDTPGQIATSAGSNTRKVGISKDATSLAITNIW